MTTVETTADRAMTTAAPKRGPLGRLVYRLTRGPINVVLAAIALMWLVPTIGLFFASLRSSADNASSGWWTALTAPAQLTIDNYQQILDNPNIVRGLVNTVLITVPTTLLLVGIAALAGYAFAWISFRGRDALFLVVIGLLVVPLQVALIPVAQLFGSLGIFGKIPAVIIFHVAFGLPFAIFLLRNFFAGIPRELLEAARMDGASEWTVFSRVVLPLGIPAIASLAIFQFLWVWNDLLVGLVFAGTRSAPLTVVIQQQTRQFGTNIDIIAPGAFLSMAIPLLVFFAFQRFFVQGLLAGGVK